MFHRSSVFPPLTCLLMALCILVLSACSKVHIIDGRGYLALADTVPEDIARLDLPRNPDDVQALQKDSDRQYGTMLFTNLSPAFMQGILPVYYIGETFSDTLQPQRSTVQKRKNDFTIDHVSQRVHVSMLATCDWNKDGDTDWLVSCAVTGKKKDTGKNALFYLVVPEPEEDEIVDAATLAYILDAKGRKSVHVSKDVHVARRPRSTIPETEMHEYAPGEQEITQAPTEPAKQGTIVERIL